ncbi:Tat pathway signal sequence domain protein [Pseudarthrobacter sp. J75]|uniref:exo-rhamnogalacturonan lyase family protein n=1 Tax=unclassified Pseudarthrobacter TaxID=2647000 RepID=UPI002E80CB36|nr:MULTISPECIES: Tat pathway signal sequence domain protein [unclassified Pseudarthrobacter]MEE2522345.1 Tat pathway signal sequence domain protein [Pseudarthrobacter sp. J47]MEE2528009.1 Tat pathway signal sequence domain protein [Pseudarthrobacter sp. J75]
MTNSTRISWLDGGAPADLNGGTTWGMPFARGTVADAAALEIRDADGRPVASQAWPLATWPDGSLKWAGLALAASESPSSSYSVTAGTQAAVPAAETDRVTVTGDAGSVTVSTGVSTMVFDRTGQHLFRSLSRGGTVVAKNGRLVSMLQQEVPEEAGTTTRTGFTGQVTSVAVEQDGPVRAVVKIEGQHQQDGGGRSWLPFVIRFYFHAGARSIRMVHSFVWDGDADRDFLAGLGVRFNVPLAAELHNRHVRIAGAGGGFLAEGVRGITGLRRDPGQAVRDAQVSGQPTPPPGEWNPEVSGRLHLVPTWSDFTLTQLTADGFELRKRTAPGHGWVGISGGTRAGGFCSLSTPDGGLGVGVRNFWQSHPGQLDIRGAAGDEATLTAWLYSPEAQPMDLRFYHDGLGQDTFEDQLEGLEITYEDYEPGFGSPTGIARTHELTLFAYDATPATEQLAADAAGVASPPLLQAGPESLHAAGVFGDWAPVDRSTPARADLEDKLDFLFDFYTGQVEQRRWYGFWNYGDVMHTYDADRHVWRYDVGGYAWDNSELSPDLWLWYMYLRSGRADVFRFAEAMTRHTGEVDVYHLGPWQGLGTRHNVQHWGCSAKQLRISTPAYRRFHYYLTADERTGDLLTELVDSDQNFLGLDPVRKVRPDAATYRPDRNALGVGLGTDWGSLAATWLTDWERTGNPRSRDRLLGTMADIGSLKYGFLTGEALYDLDKGRFDAGRERISVSHLSAVFGLVEICSELLSLVPDPAFERAWLQYCRLFLATPEEQQAAVGQPLQGIYLTQAHSRLTAYAAARLGDPDLAAHAWNSFRVGGEHLDPSVAFSSETILPPFTLQPVEEARTVSTNDAAQFGLAAIQNLALIGGHLPAET